MLKKWKPTLPAVNLPAVQAEEEELDAISACRISACGVDWLKVRVGSISACVLDYPWQHLSNKTPFLFFT